MGRTAAKSKVQVQVPSSGERPPLMKAADIAREAQSSIRWAYALMGSGLLPVVTIGGLKRVMRADWDAYLERSREQYL